MLAAVKAKHCGLNEEKMPEITFTFLVLTNFSLEFTDVRFASFLSGEFITAIVVNPPERKLAKRTSVK